MEQVKIGDRVILTSLSGEKGCYNWQRKAGLILGEEYIVSNVESVLGGCYIRLHGYNFWHDINKFRHKTDAIIIVLRRREDRRTIEKFLKKNSFTWLYVDAFFTIRKNNSRVIVIHPNTRELSYNGQVSFHNTVKQAICSTTEFLNDYFRYEKVVVVKTKPSVNQAINEIKKYI